MGNKTTNVAKSNSNITLKKHSEKVYKVAIGLLKAYIKSGDDYDRYCEILKYSAKLHDIGKCTSNFQERLKKKSKKSNLHLHNEISWVFVYKYLNVDDNILDDICYLIYWHHGIVKRKQGNTYSDEIMLEIGESDVDNMYKESINILGKDEILDHEDIRTLNKKSPIYIGGEGGKKEYEKVFLRTILITSDRLVSEYSKKSVKEIIKISKDNLNKDNPYSFENMPFKDEDSVKRFKVQNSIVDECGKTSIAKAPGGFGKTLLGLLWSIKSNKKTIWVCPRNAVAKSVYKSILNEAKDFSVDINVELYLTGEVKEKNNDTDDFSSDIIVTNIDNFLKPTIDNNMSKNLNFINSANVVFDEYHELVQQSPLFPLFTYIMNIRHNYTNSETLLLSATPVEYLTKKWDTVGNNTKILPNSESHYKPIHSKKYKINIIPKLDLSKIKEGESNLIIFNTVKNAQKVYSTINSKSKMIHGNYENDDKEVLFNWIFEKYGKHGDKKEVESVVSSTIIQASLDISFNNLYESILSPENTLQRIARVNRWGENDTSVINIFDYNDRSENLLKDSIYDKNLRLKWFNEVKKYDGKSLTLEELYEVYNKFSNTHSKEISVYIRNTYNKALKNFINIYPIKYFGERSDDNNIKATSNKLRSNGNEIFFICRRHKTAKKSGEGIEYTDPFSIEVRYNIGEMFKETDKSLKLIKTTMYKIRGDSRYDFKKLTTSRGFKNLNKDHIKFYSKYYKTPYIRRDVVYHKEYGVIDKKTLEEINVE